MGQSKDYSLQTGRVFSFFFQSAFAVAVLNCSKRFLLARFFAPCALSPRETDPAGVLLPSPTRLDQDSVLLRWAQGLRRRTFRIRGKKVSNLHHFTSPLRKGLKTRNEVSTFPRSKVLVPSKQIQASVPCLARPSCGMASLAEKRTHSGFLVGRVVGTKCCARTPD